MTPFRWWLAWRWQWLREHAHDFHSWPGKVYGVTWREGFLEPRVTTLVWIAQRRCLSCGRKRRQGHKLGCSDRK